MTEKEIYKSLKAGEPEDLLNQILAYPDPDKLNYESPGVLKEHPLGRMAEVIQKTNAPFTKKDKAFYAMAGAFAKILAADSTQAASV